MGHIPLWGVRDKSMLEGNVLQDENKVELVEGDLNYQYKWKKKSTMMI